MAYSGPIVDVDVHHTWKSFDDIVAYLPKRWREYWEGDGKTRAATSPPGGSAYTLLDGGGMGLFATPPGGGPVASDYDFMCEQLCDRYTSRYRGILTFNIGAQCGNANPYLNAALCSAINDWNIDHWLDVDERLFGSILLPSNNIEACIEEIHRIGHHTKMVGILFPMNPSGRPLGDPMFHPVYKAALEYDLTVDIHVNSSDIVTGRAGVGAPGTYIENSVRLTDPAMHYVTSFIVNGVFEKFPDLKLLVKEYGTSWLPHLIWKLDKSYEALKVESPWVKKRPYEYIYNNMKFGTQPLEVMIDQEPRWIDLLAAVDGIEDILVFASDYPHFQFDDPFAAARTLPKSWVDKVMWKNSADFFGWDEADFKTVDKELVGAPA